MATRLNNMPRPVGNAVRYIRAGARLLKRTVTRKGRRVEISFTHDHDHESVGVAQPQPRLDSQLNHHSDGAESNTTNHDIMITSSPLPLTLSTNDSVPATLNSIGTSPSQQESTFDSGEYEADLVLSAALVGDKHVPWCATTEPDLEPEPPVQADSADQNINERLNSSSSAVSVASNIYNSLKSTKTKIDNFVKWYRRELQRRNLI